MDHNFQLANKKTLFYNMKQYYNKLGKCVFKDKVFPLTFHVKSGQNDEEYERLKVQLKHNPGSIWILKPGENSNRGCGI